ncbi:MAG: SMP-30/gluconolactonase/LRE family protein, partial [Chloroflexi bacterium]|nr:SMP-30/gluconolactonase/LRE family protein [Chloroflexota bacterium]
AIWDGWQVLQLSPAGEILAEIKMPIQRPTSVTFGGKDMKTLFITSAWEGLTNAERQVQPYAGDVFAVQLEVPGRMINIVTM